MSDKMKAMVLHNWVQKWGNNLKLEEIPIPKINSNDVLVKVKACGVGLTVSNFMMGGMSTDSKLLPRIPGDEIVGEVAEKGSNVEDFKIGDRVIVYLFITCGKCRYCLTGRNDLCLNFGGWIGRTRDGGYAEYVKVPKENLFKLPEEIPFLEATVINTAVASSVHILKSRAQMAYGEDVLIIGAAGGVGVHLIQLIKLFGGRVFACDIDDEKLEKLKGYGVEFLINTRKIKLSDEVKKLTNGNGVDIAIDFVGTPQTIFDGISSLGRGGRLINLASPQNVKFEIPLLPLVINEWIITGSRYTTKYEFLQGIELVKTGKIKPVITVKRKLKDVEQIHVMLHENKVFGRGAIEI